MWVERSVIALCWLVVLLPCARASEQVRPWLFLYDRARLFDSDTAAELNAVLRRHAAQHPVALHVVTINANKAVSAQGPPAPQPGNHAVLTFTIDVTNSLARLERNDAAATLISTRREKAMLAHDVMPNLRDGAALSAVLALSGTLAEIERESPRRDPARVHAALSWGLPLAVVGLLALLARLRARSQTRDVAQGTGRSSDRWPPEQPDRARRHPERDETPADGLMGEIPEQASRDASVDALPEPDDLFPWPPRRRRHWGQGLDEAIGHDVTLFAFGTSETPASSCRSPDTRYPRDEPDRQ